MNVKKEMFLKLAVICAAILFLAPFAAADKAGATSYRTPALVVELAENETWVVEETIRLCKLVVAEGASVTAPEGYSLTMTINGVEAGGELVDTYGEETKIGTGVYRGNIVLTVAEANPVAYQTYSFPFRQALYLDDTGIVDFKSVFAAVRGRRLTADNLRNIRISSVGENFNGIYAAGGDYTIKNAKIDFFGNGRSDFAGYGAAVMSTGEGTTMVLDRAHIVTEGVVRSAIIAAEGSNMIVKNSYIQAYDGVLPDDYVPTIDTTQMRSVPWMLGLTGNCRATNLLGTNTKATYINSYIGAEGWGVLSTDGCTDPQLTAINSKIAITGSDGYGSYAIGNAIERFLGCEFNVATYATINRGGALYFGDSTAETVAQLNEDLELGLTARERRAIRPKNTVVNSNRFGIMWHGGGTVDVSGGTIFNTAEAVFLDKGQTVTITVDGSQGAMLNPGNGIIMQLMDDDDPGPDFTTMQNTNIYYEPTEPPTQNPDWDLTSTEDAAVATFSNIILEGDFYNSIGWGVSAAEGSYVQKNMALTFNNATITGVISASEAHHDITTITSEEYYELGNITNTPSPAINNGVIVTLDAGSTWTVAGTSHLTSLTIAEGAVITAPECNSVSMTVDGVETAIEAGTYAGNLVLTVTESDTCP